MRSNDLALGSLALGATIFPPSGDDADWFTVTMKDPFSIAEGKEQDIQSRTLNPNGVLVISHYGHDTAADLIHAVYQRQIAASRSGAPVREPGGARTPDGDVYTWSHATMTGAPEGKASGSATTKTTTFHLHNLVWTRAVTP